MIPVWLLTILHYVSLASAVVILLLLAWPSYRSLVSQTRTHNAQTTSENGTSVSEQ
jgi:Tfp pilus assembly protein PilE